MILQRPRRKKVRSVKNKTNNMGSAIAGHALPNCPSQGLPLNLNGHHRSTRPARSKAGFEPLRPQNHPWGPSGSLTSRSLFAPHFFPPLPVTSAIDQPLTNRVPNFPNQQPALYDLIYSKFDAVITSIDEESFSGDKEELGRSMA